MHNNYYEYLLVFFPRFLLRRKENSILLCYEWRLHDQIRICTMFSVKIEGEKRVYDKCTNGLYRTHLIILQTLLDRQWVYKYRLLILLAPFENYDPKFRIIWIPMSFSMSSVSHLQIATTIERLYYVPLIPLRRSAWSKKDTPT